MHKSLEAVCSSLEALAVAITNGWTGETTFNETWGWNCPPLTRHDLAALPRRLAKRIQDRGVVEIEATLLPQIIEIPRRLQLMQSSTVPQLWGGNNPWASLNIIGTLESFEKILSPLLESQESQVIEKEKVEAAKSLRRILHGLRALEVRLAEAGTRSENLHEKVERIEHAHEAADQLPTDLKELAEKREDVAKLLRESITDRGAVGDKLGEIIGIRAQLENKDKEAAAVLERCEAAYRATTSQGLASAFAKRSKSLGFSMWVWVFGLIAALVVGANIGSNQLHELSKAITDSTSQTNNRVGSVWVEMILTVLSIGAPVWFAWVATKQLGQRFRLAEDYGYKAHSNTDCFLLH